MTISYVYRGGCWGSRSDRCRSAYRYGDPPDFRLNPLGFRVLRSSKEEVKYRVARGGGWYSHPGRCRSAIRFRNSPDYRFNSLGFRVLKDTDV
jgi:formylglycine-generating enzyme required for sulfatase activity